MWVEAPVVVVQALDVVLTEAGSVLDLDEHQGLRARVLDPVSRADRSADRHPGIHLVRTAVDGDLAPPANDEPVLGTVGVALIAEAVPGLDGQPFHLVGVFVREDLEAGSAFGGHAQILLSAGT